MAAMQTVIQSESSADTNSAPRSWHACLLNYPPDTSLTETERQHLSLRDKLRHNDWHASP